jgi:hypothetical protein
LQNLVTEQHDHMDSMDQLTKHLGQTQSIVKTIVSDEHFKIMSSSDLANLLWLIDDGLEGIKKSSNELINHIQNNKNN